MSDERLNEIRDLLAQLLEHSRSASLKQDEAMQEYRAAMVGYRKVQRVGTVGIVILLALLALSLVR